MLVLLTQGYCQGLHIMGLKTMLGGEIVVHAGIDGFSRLPVYRELVNN